MKKYKLRGFFVEVRRGLRRVSLSLNGGGLSLAAMTARGLERDENGVISYVWLLVIVWVFLELQGKDMEIVERWCWHSAQRPLSLSLSFSLSLPQLFLP